MLIKWGSLATDGRGSVAGLTFSRNRGGSYVRARVKPTNRQSPKQMIVRNRLQTLQTTYRDTLTAPERNGWIQLAEDFSGVNKLGATIKHTGPLMFIRTNAVRLRCNKAIIVAAPAAPADCPCPVATFTGSTAAGIELTALTPVLGAGDAIAINFSYPTTQRVSYYHGPWAYTPYADDVTVLPYLLLLGSALTIGDRFHIEYHVVSAIGRVSPKMRTYVDITA